MSASPFSTAVIPPAKVSLSAFTSADAVREEDAAARLAASRQRLRQALFAIVHPPPQPPLFADGIGNVRNRLLDRVKSLPMAAALLEGLDSWWQRHPLHRAANASGTSQARRRDSHRGRVGHLARLWAPVAMAAAPVSPRWRHHPDRAIRLARTVGQGMEKNLQA